MLQIKIARDKGIETRLFRDRNPAMTATELEEFQQKTYFIQMYEIKITKSVIFNNYSTSAHWI